MPDNKWGTSRQPSDIPAFNRAFVEVLTDVAHTKVAWLSPVERWASSPVRSYAEEEKGRPPRPPSCFDTETTG